MEKDRKFTVQDMHANYIQKYIELEEKYTLKGIKLIEDIREEQFDALEYRDSYFNIIDKINNKEHVGHAICLVGLRRTGKSILLNQLHLNAEKFGVKQEEIIHITLSVIMNGKEMTRDVLDYTKLSDENRIEYPSLDDLTSFIKQIKSYKTVKCIMIDEVTLCKDLILAGKGFIDSLVNSGIIVILAGTESASFNIANENSLYSRLIIEDISYIPFGEYCRLKKIELNSPEEKQMAMERYIKHGNILDDTIEVDERYIESALGVNVALSIVNSDFEEFIGCEHNVKELVQSIIKYYKLIGESITINNVKAELTRADITRAINNENRRRKRESTDTIDVSKSIRTQIAVDAAEEIFKEYNLDFGLSKIPLSMKQLCKIDDLFSQMGLLYNLSIIPEIAAMNGAVNADDLTILHSLSYTITQNMVNKIMMMPLGLNDEDVQILAREIESTAKGKIIEGIVTLQFIKALEKQQRLLTCLKSYENGKFETERKCTKHRMYKYNNKIFDGGASVNAEIDIVVSEPDVINLIEIKKSHEIDEHQVRWLNNEIVISEIKEKVSNSKPMKKYLYYMGEDTIVGDIQYKNIVDVLISHYNNYLKR